MNMRSTIKAIILAGTIYSVAMIAGCGGGGGSASQTFVSGTASKGIIYPGTVTFLGVSADGTKSTEPLATTTTDTNGRYATQIGYYAGALVVEVYGTYTDEATGAKLAISPTAPMHAVVPKVDQTSLNYRQIAVTPLTEMAYELMGPSLIPAKITAANSRVAELFKISDILAVQPVRADAAIMSDAKVTSDQQAYTMAIATLSQMAKNSSGGAPASFQQVMALVASFASDLSASPTAGLSSTHLSAFSTALTEITAPTAIMPGFDTAEAILAQVGSKVMKLTLAAANVPTGVQLGALKVTVQLPPGVSIRATSSGETLPDMIVPAGALANGSTYITGNYQSASRTLTASLVNSAGFTSGDCATFTFDLVPGTSVTAANFSVTLNEAKDAGQTYASVAGVSVDMK